MPKELILNRNIYLDPTFKTLHGSDHFKKVKQIIAKVSEIYQHPSLVTKMKIVHNNRIFDSYEKIRDMVTCGSVLASGAQPPASVTNFFQSAWHTLCLEQFSC